MMGRLEDPIVLPRHAFPVRWNIPIHLQAGIHSQPDAAFPHSLLCPSKKYRSENFMVEFYGFQPYIFVRTLQNEFGIMLWFCFWERIGCFLLHARKPAGQDIGFSGGKAEAFTACMRVHFRRESGCYFRDAAPIIRKTPVIAQNAVTNFVSDMPLMIPGIRRLFIFQQPAQRRQNLEDTHSDRFSC